MIHLNPYLIVALRLSSVVASGTLRALSSLLAYFGTLESYVSSSVCILAYMKASLSLSEIPSLLSLEELTLGSMNAFRLIKSSSISGI
jgi:hypothetical protein